MIVDQLLARLCLTVHGSLAQEVQMMLGVPCEYLFLVIARQQLIERITAGGIQQSVANTLLGDVCDDEGLIGEAHDAEQRLLGTDFAMSRNIDGGIDREGG